MRIIVIAAIVWLCCAFKLTSQTLPLVKGIVESSSEKPLQGALIQFENDAVKTNFNGEFSIENCSLGTHILKISMEGFTTQNIPVRIFELKEYDVGIIYLEESITMLQDESIVLLTDDDLQDDTDRSSDYIAGLFQSSKDAYLKAAAYSFSQAWYKVRGYDSSYGSILINGVEMNKLFDGRPQWSNWGGLNDVFKNQEFSNGLDANTNAFGGILATTNFSTRASEYQKGGKVSFASTNKSYTGRVMATYATGLTKNNWAFVASGSRRFANEGYIDATSYNAWSAFLAAEKKLSSHHSLNLTAFAAFNRRGKSSPNTQEVYNLKGFKYNSYWGNQDGDIRNSRKKEIFEPMVMFTHFYDSKKTQLKTTVSYQFGHIGNSRLGYFNAPNPDPTYWKYLPSSYVRFIDDLDYEGAYLAEQNFIENGQINWGELYKTNIDNVNSLYYLYEDRVDDTQISFNSTLSKNINENLLLNAGISYKNITSDNYAKMLDLLGGNGFVDLDQYAVGEAQQNDLNNVDRLIGKNDEFQYHYKINASVAGIFAQVQGFQKKIDYFVGINLKNTNYQREGLYKNGTYPSNSFGKGEKQSFSDFGVKGGLTYKFTGRHLVNVNAAYISNAPTIRNTFSNARVNNNITPNLTSEKIVTGDLSYIFRAQKLQTRFTAFYTKFTDAVETSFFFAEGLRGDQADFVNEIMTGVAKKNLGAELSLEYKVTPSIKLLGAGSFGQYTYDNNPQLYLESESFTDENSDFGTAYLKDYRISGTPQRAYSVGFEYQDPDFWWFQTNANFLTNNYLDISPLLRTNNFYLDSDGTPFIDAETGVEVTQEQVNSLLKQEKFDDAFLVNVVGGKSWKINEYYLGFFAGINNVLGETFKTGGFEQSRNANYQELKEDKQLKKPVFGPKYWYGNKTSYYVNVYVRF